MKRYYTTDKNGDSVEVDQATARELVRIGKKRPEDFEVEDVPDAVPQEPKAQEVSSAEKSVVVESAKSAAPIAAERAKGALEASTSVPRLVMEFVNPNITAWQDTSQNAKGLRFLIDPEYWKAAGRDVVRMAPYITAPIGGEAAAAMSPSLRALYSSLRGAAESGLYANAENALGGKQQNPIDAMAIGAALGGGMQAAGDVAASSLPKLYRSSLDVMARRGGVSPEALEAYSTQEGRAAVAKAFGSEKEIANDMLRASGPGFMDYMPEAQQLNKLFEELPGDVNLGFLANDFSYNPTASSGGGGMFQGEKAAYQEIASMQEPFMRNGMTLRNIYMDDAEKIGPQNPFRAVTPSQLNNLRKRLGADLDKSWNALQAGLPPDAEKTGQQVYHAIREKLLDVAEQNGSLETAKQLLADQARMLGARDEFLSAWVGGAKTSQKANQNIRSNIAGVLNNPSIRKLDQMEKLVQFDRAMGTDFAGRVIDASNARQIASNTARLGDFYASMSPKTTTGLGGTNPIFAAMNIASGASPAVGARYAGNLKSIADMAQVAKIGAPASALTPTVQAQILGATGSQPIAVQEVTKQWSSIDEMDKARKKKSK